MHVNPFPKFVCMPSNFVLHANGNKRCPCWDGRGVEVVRLIWSGGGSWDWSDRMVQGWVGLPPYVWKPRAPNSLTRHDRNIIFISYGLPSLVKGDV
jgi:hypothetical protein